MRVCQLITNPFTLDTRVRKECATLREIGCDVAAVGVLGQKRPPRERLDGVRVVRVQPGPNTRKTLATLAGRVARDRFGGTRLFPLALGAVDRGRGLRRRVGDVRRRATNVARRIVKRALRRGDPTSTPRPEEAIAGPLATESRLRLLDHAVFWLGTILGILLAPVLVVLGPPVLLVLWLLRTVARAIIAAVRWVAGGTLRWTRRHTKKSLAPALRRVKEQGRRRLAPVRQRVHRFARGIEMVDAAYRIDANVYQANDYDTLIATWIVATLRGVPFVYDIHELYDESFPTRKPFRTRYMIRLVEKRLIRRAVRTITVGDEIARIMHERYRVPRPAVVRNAQVYEGRPEPEPFLREAIGDVAAGRTGERRRMLLVYAGRIAKGRGLEESVLAMRDLDPERVALVILGDGAKDRKRILEALVREHDLSDRVHLVPAIESSRLPGVLADADVGLMLTQPACLSYYYGLGNKLFHYVNAGIPVLVPRQPEKERFVETHGVGVCCDELTPEGIARAVTALLDRPAWLDALKHRCLVVAPTVSWQGEADVYRSIYEDVYERILFSAGPSRRPATTPTTPSAPSSTVPAPSSAAAAPA